MIETCFRICQTAFPKGERRAERVTSYGESGDLAIFRVGPNLIVPKLSANGKVILAWRFVHFPGDTDFHCPKCRANHRIG